MANPFDTGGIPSIPSLTQGFPMPQMPQAPLSGRSGFMREAQIEQALRAQKRQEQMDLLSLQAQMEKMKEYQANAGWREAMRRAGISESDATTSTIGRRREAETADLETKATRGREMLPSDIEAARASNAAKITESQAAQMEMFADMLDSTFDPSSPMAVAQYKQILDDSRVPPNNPLRRLEQAPTPEAFKQGYQAMRSSLENNLKQRRSLSKTGLEKGADYDRAVSVAGMDNASRERIAAGNQAAARDAAEARTSKAVTKLEGDLVQLRQKRRASTDPAEQKRLDQEINEVRQDLFALGAIRAPLTPVIGPDGQLTYPGVDARVGQAMGNRQAPAPQGNRPPLGSFQK